MFNPIFKIVCFCCDSEETNLLISLLLGHSLWRKDREIYIFYILSLLSHVQLFGTPWTAALQAPLSFTISQSLLKFTSLESMIFPEVLSSATLFSFCLQSFPASGSFPMSQLFTGTVASKVYRCGWEELPQAWGWGMAAERSYPHQR